MVSSSVPSVPAKKLLESLRGRGFRFHVKADRLLVSPAGGLSDADRKDIAANKADLIGVLGREDADLLAAIADGSRLIDLASWRRFAASAGGWNEAAKEAWENGGEARAVRLGRKMKGW